MPVHAYTNWNKRESDHKEQVEPFRKYFFIDEKGSYSHAYIVLHDVTGMNAKKNPLIGDLAENVLSAISQEKKINQDIHHCKGVVTSNIGSVIESIMNDKPKI